MKLRKILVLVALLIAAVILVSIIRHFQLRDATNAYISKLKAQGEPMDLAQVLPPPVAPEKNSAESVRKAEALIKSSHSLLATIYFYAMKMVAPGKAMIRFQQPDVREIDATNSWAEVDAAVSKNQEDFQLLRSLIEKPQLDFGIDYQRGIADITYSNLCLVECKHAAQRLQTAILCDLHRGDAASAIQNQRAILAIVKGMREERLVISELVRIAIANIAMASTWEILQSTNLTDASLALLQNDWSNLEFFRAEEQALEMERASGAITIENYRNSSAALMNSFHIGEDVYWREPLEMTSLDRFRLHTRVLRWRFWWSYTDELRALKGYQALLDAPRAARTNYALLSLREDTFAKIYKLSITNTEYASVFLDPVKSDIRYLQSSSITTLAALFNRVMKIEVAKQLTITAIALKRYHLEHAAFPKDLAALVPNFLPAAPLDPIDGQPLRYRLNADGSFLLYSIGDDGKDDAGDPTSSKAPNAVQWQHGRDWVWPQPATAEEIQKYYANPPK